MFLTKLELDPRLRLSRKFLGSPQAMHAVVMKACSRPLSDGPADSPYDLDGRVLWRVDGSHSGTVLYVMSPGVPEMTQLENEAGVAHASARTLDYVPFLNRLEVGQEWAFRLAANPVLNRSRGEGVRGQRVGHVTVAQQCEWLERRAGTHGFSLNAGASVVVTRRERPVFGRERAEGDGRDRVTINRTVFEGLLRVDDAALMRQTLVRGLGPSKAYGCGLLTLARAGGES